MPHQLTSYIMVQSILMTRSVPSHHLLFDPLMLLCCMGISVNFSELFRVLAESFNPSLGTNRGSPPQRPHWAAFQLISLNSLGYWPKVSIPHLVPIAVRRHNVLIGLRIRLSDVCIAESYSCPGINAVASGQSQ